METALHPSKHHPYPSKHHPPQRGWMRCFRELVRWTGRRLLHCWKRRCHRLSSSQRRCGNVCCVFNCDHDPPATMIKTHYRLWVCACIDVYLYELLLTLSSIMPTSLFNTQTHSEQCQHCLKWATLLVPASWHRRSLSPLSKFPW